jgi:hypothetical protein
VFSNPSAPIATEKEDVLEDDTEKEDVLEDDEYDEDEVSKDPKDSPVQEPVKSSPVAPSEGEMPF